MVRRVSRRNYRSKRVKSRGSRSLRKKVRSRSLRSRRSLRRRRMRGGRNPKGEAIILLKEDNIETSLLYRVEFSPPSGAPPTHPDILKLKIMHDFSLLFSNFSGHQKKAKVIEKAKELNAVELNIGIDTTRSGDGILEVTGDARNNFRKTDLGLVESNNNSNSNSNNHQRI